MPSTVLATVPGGGATAAAIVTYALSFFAFLGSLLIWAVSRLKPLPLLLRVLQIFFRSLEARSFRL